MKFSEVSAYFDRMGSTRKRTELVSILIEMFRSSGDDLRRVIYLTQGKLGPDYLGIEIGIADKLIVKALSTISGIPEKDVESQYRKIGDLGSVAKEILASKQQESLFSSELSVEYVFSGLMKIAEMSGSGSIRGKISTFTDLLLNATPEEGMYLTRIVTGKLRLGVSDATILEALAECFSTGTSKEDIEESYNFHPDLGELGVMLASGKVEEATHASPIPMIPFKVMLAERLPSIPEILDKMGGMAAFEYKYDGMRVQIHSDGASVRIFSRGIEETTSNFPDIVKNARQAFGNRKYILDGEAVPYNPETGELYPFQIVSQRRGRKYDLESMVKQVPLVVFLFDILYLDDKSTHRLPYPERRKILESLIHENDNFKPAHRIVSSDAKEVEAFFESSINDGCEGLVAKNISDESIYRAGARGWLWIKLKRDYTSEFEDSLDLVVIGAFAGHGRRKGTYGALLMASYSKERDVFESVCKLGTGFSDEVLFNLPSMMSGEVVKEIPQRVETGLQPDFWIYPRFVLEVRGAEITISPVHRCSYGKVQDGAGLAIRFPRFTGRFREDKKPEDAT
ncbi:MAG: ATP-dependent DNA ligase, partial [Thermoplasmataceae archaeon]